YLLGMSMSFAASADSVTLHAAGSLKTALGEVAESYAKAYGTEVSTKFGPSGILRAGIEAGAEVDVFASANMAHPEKLAAAGWGAPVVLFAHNQLCALVQPGVDATSDNLLATLLDEDTRVGTSTPGADPSGDYAWELFRKAETIKEGSFAILADKALQLTGGPDSEQAPPGRNKYGWVMSEGKADVFLTYCTNAVLAQQEVAELDIVQLPAALAVGADYGLVTRADAAPAAWQLALYILSAAGQEILAEYGFESTALAAVKEQ
ncbi:MAG TPA: molybdate ABC transporter substrate-binding protein, partial [Salinisphaeraceae bacterium]|nr:molybdate ABC transporter substrate-binding protein [Salinisphaeraceae bacterium]